MESIPLGTCRRWSLYTGGLYLQVVFKAGVTISSSISVFLGIGLVRCVFLLSNLGGPSTM